MKVRRNYWPAYVLVLFLISHCAHGVLITHENQLEIEFEFATPPARYDYDLLRFIIFGRYFGGGKAIEKLYDGDKLLGTQMGGPGKLTQFRAIGAPEHFGDPIFVDFETILNGSIMGRLTYTFREGSSRELDIDNLSIGIWKIRSPSQAFGFIGDYPRITSVAVNSVRVPEPSTTILALCALVLFTRVRKKC